MFEYRAYTNNGMIAIGNAVDLTGFLNMRNLWDVRNIEIYVGDALVYKY